MTTYTKKYSKYKKINKITKITKKKNQLGGVKIGKGSFGCVVKPFIKCKKTYGSNQKNLVSKIIFRNTKIEHLTKELENYNLIKNIDRKNKYFITYFEICELKKKNLLLKSTKTNNSNSKNFKNNKEIRNNIVSVEFKDKKGDDYKIIKNNFINSNNINNNNLEKLYSSNKDKGKKGKKTKINDLKCYIDFNNNPINIIMIDGGIDLSKVLNKDKYINYQENIKLKYKTYFLKLLLGLKKLHKNEFSHRDIKLLNILCKPDNISNDYNTINNKTYLNFRYIDFGLTTNIKKLNKMNDITISGTPGYKSPEFVILNSVYKILNDNFDPYNEEKVNHLKKIIIKTIKTDILKKNKKKNLIRKNLNINNNQKYTYFDSDSIISDNDIKKLINNLYSSYVKKNLFNNFIQNYNGYHYKSDIYALGVTFFEIYYKLNLKDEKLLDLIRNMVKCVPEERFNVKQCLNHIFFQTK